MSEAEIIDFISKNFEGVDLTTASKENGAPESAWGDSFFFYDPDGSADRDKRFPFATLVVKDYAGFDEESNLNRPGIFRLNIGVGRETFRSLFAEDAKHDFTALDTLMPHPVYGAMNWVSVLNPTNETFESKVKPLLQEAYDRAAGRGRKP